MTLSVFFLFFFSMNTSRFEKNKRLFSRTHSFIFFEKPVRFCVLILDFTYLTYSLSVYLYPVSLVTSSD